MKSSGPADRAGWAFISPGAHGRVSLPRDDAQNILTLVKKIR